MKKSIEVTLVVLSILAIAVIAFQLSYVISTNLILVPVNPNHDHEKITIQAVSYNSTDNSIAMYAKAFNDIGSNAIFTNITLKDSYGYFVASYPVSDKLNELELTILTVRLRGTLTSGSYTATLSTTKGASFVSPSFIVP